MPTLEDHIIEYLRFVVTLKDVPVTIKTFIFQIETTFFTFNYSADIYLLFENFDISKSKFEQVVFELNNFITIYL